MNLSKKVYIICLLLVSSLISCGQQTYKQKLKSLYRNTVPLIKTEELEIQQKNYILLDTRSEKEFEISHLEGAFFLDYDTPKLEKLDSLDKNQPIIVYCSVGYRSERIGEKLQKIGFTNVKNLYGGIFEWKNKGKNVYNRFNLPTDSVHTYNKKWSKWLEKGVKVYE